MRNKGIQISAAFWVTIILLACFWPIGLFILMCIGMATLIIGVTACLIDELMEEGKAHDGTKSTTTHESEAV
jgi:hypothetical protein